jgi:hypothetical protein
VSIFSRKSSEHDPDGRFSEDGRPLRWIAVALLGLFVVMGAWLGFQALSAKSSLEKARESAQQVKDALLDGKTDEAAQKAKTALAQAQSARSTTHSGPWNIAAGVPFFGGPFKTGQQISDVVAGLSSDILQPAADAGIGLSPSKLFQDGQVDVQLLRQQEPELVKLSDSATRLDEKAAAIRPAGFVAPLDNARTQLQNQTSEIASLLNNTTIAARIGPSMMGADGPRTYLMVFQTNAEARGTGGLIGGFGVLRFDNGKPTVDTLDSNVEFRGASADVDLGPEFNQNYGASRPFTDFRNSNQSAHFPYAAQIWKSMWEKQSGKKVDGVIATDPVALSYLLGAEGSVKLQDGQVVTQDNVVELTESTAYRMFPTDQAARKEYLQEIANAVVKKMTGQNGQIKSPGKLLDALGRAASERRIMVWSEFPAEQKVLEETTLAHTIPDDAAPYAQVVINNLGGNKMDYYLRREIEYDADGCDGDVRNSTITVRLSNTRSDSESEWASVSQGLPRGLPIKIAPGTMVSSVRVLATKGATLESVTADGRRLVPNVETFERGHPSFEVQVVIPSGQTGELRFLLSEPASPGEPNVPIQPLIDTITPVVTTPQCPE